MKTNSKLLVRFVATVCMLSCFTYWMGIAPSEAVLIGGKSLGSISDIVKAATGSEFSELPKHSLLIYERHRNGSNMRYKSSILTVSADGSLRKRLGEFVEYDSSYLPYDASTGVVQNMEVAISPKPFGKRRNILYTTSGLNVDWDGYADGMADSQTIESTGEGDTTKITIPARDTQAWRWGARQMWGNAVLTVKGMEDKDIFVMPNSSPLDMDGDFYLYFMGVDRKETGNISTQRVDVQGGNIYFGYKVRDHARYYSILAADVAVGDFNGDGYKNEILLAYTDNGGTVATIFTVKSTDGKTLTVTRNHDSSVYVTNQPWGTNHAGQPSVAAVTGDFDGDGRDEAAIVTRTSFTDIKVQVLKYQNGWSIAELGAPSDFVGPLKATRADLNGDGQDEIVMLVVADSGGTLYPRLEFWGFNQGSILPVRNVHCNKGGAGDTSLLGYAIGGNEYNQSYKVNEDFCITAGPLTGTNGKAKLADDIVISHINSNRSSVYVIPPVLNSNKDFTNFGTTKTVFNYIDSSAGRRGAVVTADFANETLFLGEPTHTMDDNDESYVTILQAMPYHVDNVDVNGQLMPYLINYTFSGFKGDGDSNGEMSVSYTRTDKATTKNDVSFNMASTTETIALLGDAGPYVHDYLKFRTMQANIAGNFDSRAKAAADTMNMVMDFVTDKIDITDTNSTSQANQKETTQVDEALLWDKVISYSAQQHIWRYKILNDPLPSWYKLGAKVDNIRKDLKPESQDRYLTFSMYDDATKTDVDTHSTNTYQARHEEGNFFSYPSGTSQIPGYTENEALANEQWVAWSKGSSTSTTISFAQAKISSHSLEEKIQESELNKTVSAIAALFGADDPNPLPPYTGHSETFSKSLESAEAIRIGLYGKSTIPGEQAGHRILSMPFIAREGTLKVAHAVELADGMIDRQTSLLWGDNSRYRLHPDPALVLPKKFVRGGSNIYATTNNALAMQMRGLRFYVPDIDMLSDTHLVAGLTYEIKVPIYNASFISTGSFDVKLSYANASEFSISAPHTKMDKLQAIQTITMSLKGWGDNKGWAEFTWTIPEEMVNGTYIFFVQIDPDNKDLKDEVHESRLNYSTGEIIDVGGNNEGYFAFNITAKDEVRKKHVTAAAIMAGEYKPEPSDGVLCSAVFRGGQASDSGKLMAAVETLDQTGTLSADVRLNDWESDEDNATLIALMGLIYELAGVSEDYTVPVKFTVTYEGDTYYPEVYLRGINLKPGARERLASENASVPQREDIASVFCEHRMALVPNTTVEFMLDISPRALDWENGSAFEFYVPELAAASVLAEIADSKEETSDSGEDIPESEGDDSGTETPTTSTLGSSGGGCDALSGSFVLLGFAVMAFLTQKKH